MILGFTGTRRGLSKTQLSLLPRVIATLPDIVLHGGEAHTDSEFDAWLFREMDLRYACRVEVYPARFHEADRRSWALWVQRQGGDPETPRLIHPGEKPLRRNAIIAERCDALLACPGEMIEQLRSGTWATIRYARVKRKPITILYPNGAVMEECWP
jgi:hypothetical protein